MRERWKRAGLAFLSVVFVTAAVMAATTLLFNLGVRSPFIGYVSLSIVCLATYLVAVRWIERRAPAELSLSPAPPEFGTGLLVGAAQFSLVMLILWAAGAYRPQGWNGFAGIGSAFVFWLAVGVREELFYRGLIFRLLSQVIGTWGALIVSAAIFGGMHITNAGWTVAGLISVALAGVMFAAAYVATGRLWLPIGIHTTWNFTQSAVFGLNVSGNDTGSGLIAGTLTGPDYLTGGPFGPEATFATVIVVLATTAYFIWRIVTLRRAEPPIWHRADISPVTTTPT